MPQLLITAVGPDRPGIVGELTGHLHAAGGNILDSRMVNLRGQFAMMILLDAADATAGTLTRDLPGHGHGIGLQVTVRPQAPEATHVDGMHYRLKTYSLDQPGIVARISKVLRDHGVNIEELSATQESAPFAGDPLFTTEMRLTVPGKTPLRKLRTDLDTLCNELNCDLDLDPD